MYDHITWNVDAMVFKFPKHKGDQEGRTSIPKHVYANPLNPTICPILAFAVLVFSGIRGFQDEIYERQV